MRNINWDAIEEIKNHAKSMCMLRCMHELLNVKLESAKYKHALY